MQDLGKSTRFRKPRQKLSPPSKKSPAKSQAEPPLVDNQQQENNVNRQALYNALPATFNRQGYVQIAQQLHISPRTAERHVGALVEIGQLRKPAFDTYEKPTP